MKATFLKSVTKNEDLPVGNKPHIIFVGRSNVGKSSLLNALTNQKKLARVSATPGRTRLINLFDVDGRCFLVDLPGYGFSKSSHEKRDEFNEMVYRYLSETPQIKLIFHIIDARIGLTDLDLEMLKHLELGHTPFAIVVNKMDKLSNEQSILLMRKLEKDFPTAQLFPHSNVTGKGRGEIWQAIEKVIRANI